MKVSFSRKGFDSSNGRQANAILPDGTMLPFPIPGDGLDTYGDLSYNGTSLYDIINQLYPNTRLTANDICHLDPDLRKDIKHRSDGWIPSFGQADQSLSELRNNGFGKGDLFLFFGWFKPTEYANGKLRYIQGAKDLHIIYGYMQVGEILTCEDVIPQWLSTHPHAPRLMKGSKKDAIFLPTKTLSFNESLPGAGLLKFSEDLILTHPEMTRGKWKLPKCFDDIKIGHSPKQPCRQEYFLTPCIGQEMVWEATSEAMEWLKTIIK
jgi:hypothetical protein